MLCASILAKLSLIVQILKRNLVCCVGFAIFKKCLSSFSQQIFFAYFKLIGLIFSRSTPIGQVAVAQATAFLVWLMLKNAFSIFFKKGFPLILKKFKFEILNCFFMQNAAKMKAARLECFFEYGRWPIDLTLAG